VPATLLGRQVGAQLAQLANPSAVSRSPVKKLFYRGAAGARRRPYSRNDTAMPLYEEGLAAVLDGVEQL
jgi:hypothetical protein